MRVAMSTGAALMVMERSTRKVSGFMAASTRMTARATMMNRPMMAARWNMVFDAPSTGFQRRSHGIS
jgi:hypothetical protein